MKQILARAVQLRLSRRALAGLMMALFMLSLVPLLAVALYNYPADDDFEFVLPAAAAWINTSSLWETVKAIAQKTFEKYMTWQGDFFSTFLFAITPTPHGQCATP